MKIAFDAKRLYCNFTGLGNHSRTSLDILMRYFPDNEYVLFTPKVKENVVTKAYLDNPSLTTVRPTGLLKGGLWRTFGLANEVKSCGADLFHGLSNELPVGIGRSGVPSVVTIHDVAFRTFTDMYHWQDRHIYDLKWRYACRHADRIIAISECTKRDIMRFYDVPEDKIDVVYQPVNPAYYTLAEKMLAADAKHDCSSTPKIPQQLSENPAAAPKKSCSSSEEILQQENPEPAPYMLYVGSINSRKNLLGVVKALALLPEDIRIPLVVVGNGREYKREVEAFIAAVHLEPWIIWQQGFAVEQLQALYRGARLFVYPSFYEGFGLPVVEARLCGCPVITSNVSSLPEAAGSHALQVDPNDSHAISEAMQRLITDDNFHDSLARQSQQEALQTLHPQVLAQRLMEVYKKVR